MAFSRLRYYRRLFDNYVLRKRSHLGFWHERPAVTPDFPVTALGRYPMTFADKARYQGPFDARGVALLDYGGSTGKQYNPIAIAQYGIAQFHADLDGVDGAQERLLKQADWLVGNLEPNALGVPVWMHRFDWEYGSGLHAPWYSGLAQGQGVSCLLRAHATTKDARYRRAAQDAFRSMTLDIESGGVLDRSDGVWIEEYLTEPRSHILNGFLWASWGVHDMVLAKEKGARELWNACVTTLERDLPRFDTGYWSLYDLMPARGRCVASPFYHQLHITQLEAMLRLTGRAAFHSYAAKWRRYAEGGFNRRRAWMTKAAFKLANY